MIYIPQIEDLTQQIETIIHKNDTHGRMSANQVLYEFSYFLSLIGINNQMEYTGKEYINNNRKCRFDIMVFKEDKPAVIIEVKNRDIKVEFTDLKQLKRYSIFNLPVVLLENVNHIEGCLNSLYKYINFGIIDDYFIYK